MKVLVINGSLHAETDTLQDYLDKFANRRRELGDEVTQIALAGKKIRSCIGCYSCWLQTPGLCCLKDDQEEILKGVVRSDQTIWASPLSMGFVSSAIKNATDRLLPAIHPYLKMNEDRMSHFQRYDKAWINILLLEAGPDLDEDTFKIISDIYSRYKLVDTTEKKPEVVANETYRL